MKPLFIILFILLSLACKSPGRRLGLHGMVVYGSQGSYFLDHIPMEHAPHDLQVITSITLKDKGGNPVTLDLSKSTFTIKPTGKFSLDDYAAKKITKFTADLYQGGFEQDGTILLDSVQVEVKEINLVRKVPADSLKPSLVISGFEINIITPERNYQMIKNGNGDVLWCVKGPDFFEACD